MNFSAHIAVAAHLSDPDHDAGWLLGSALPDLAAMGGFRLLGATSDEAVSRGIGCHHATDRAFHQHRWFTERNRALRGRLAELGVARGPARACSHVGIELLLDGELMSRGPTQRHTASAVAAVGPRRQELTSLVPTRPQAWQRHLDLLASRPLPLDNHDPQRVALRLHRILSNRPLLALDEAMVDVVAEALAEYKPAIDTSAEEIVTAVAAEVSSPTV